MQKINSFLKIKIKIKSFLKIKIAEQLFLPSVGFEPTTSGIRDQRLTHSTTRACDRIQIQSRLLYND